MGDGQISARAFSVSDLVAVRGLVVDVRAHSVVVRLPRLGGAALLIEEPISEVYALPDTAPLAEAAALLVDRLDRLQELGMRVVAEVYELGGHALPLTLHQKRGA